jgi:hypothetical protein
VAQPQITLDEAAAAAVRNGIDMRLFELVYDPGGLGFGSISVSGAGRLVRSSSGRIRLRLTDLALQSELDAVQTVAHELNHVRGCLRRGMVSDEADAEAAARRAGQYFRR